MNDPAQDNLIARQSGAHRNTITWQHWYGLLPGQKRLTANLPSWWEEPKALSDEEQRERKDHQKQLEMTLRYQYAFQIWNLDCIETDNLLELRAILCDNVAMRNDFSFKVDGAFVSCQEECRIHAFQLREDESCLLVVPNHYRDNASQTLLSEHGTKITFISNSVRCEMYCMEYHTLADVRRMIPHVLHLCQLPPERDPLLDVGYAASVLGLPLYKVRPDVRFTFYTNSEDFVDSEAVLYPEDEDRITINHLLGLESIAIEDDEDDEKIIFWLE